MNTFSRKQQTVVVVVASTIVVTVAPPKRRRKQTDTNGLPAGGCVLYVINIVSLLIAHGSIQTNTEQQRASNMISLWKRRGDKMYLEAWFPQFIIVCIIRTAQQASACSVPLPGCLPACLHNQRQRAIASANKREIAQKLDFTCFQAQLGSFASNLPINQPV